MTSTAEQVNDHARLTAREFVESWSGETGELTAGIVADRMRFAYEMGYLRGHGTGQLSAFDTLLRGERTAGIDHVGEVARFAAREFVASWLRELGDDREESVIDRLRLAYEMGYLRGHGAGLLISAGLLQRMREECE